MSFLRSTMDRSLVRIHPGQVAGVEPAAGKGLAGGLRPVPVARHQIGTPHDQLPDLVDGRRLHVIVHDPRLQVK